MTASAMLDTSYMITLTNRARPNHLVAVAYYRHMIAASIPMYFSSIAVSEFSVKQSILDLPQDQFIYLPFNVPDGIECARLQNELSRDVGDSRTVVRDDIKLIAQAAKAKISFLLTDDKNTMHKYCERLRVAGLISLSTVRLDSGFDDGAFNLDGQVGFGFPIDNEALDD